MNDALHASTTSGFKQYTCVLDCRIVSEILLAFVVTYPIGIVQNFSPFKGCNKTVHIVEIETVDFDFPIKRVVSPYGIGQRSDVNILLEQMMSYPST